MLEMRFGKDLIRPNTSAAVTLSLLHAFIGPLPPKFADLASKNMDIPVVTIGNNVLFFGNKKKKLDFSKIGLRPRDLEMIAKEAEDGQRQLASDRDGREFSDLMNQVIIYDPAKRITAAEALKHKYFKLEIKKPLQLSGRTTGRTTGR